MNSEAFWAMWSRTNLVINIYTASPRFLAQGYWGYSKSAWSPLCWMFPQAKQTLRKAVQLLRLLQSSSWLSPGFLFLQFYGSLNYLLYACSTPAVKDVVTSYWQLGISQPFFQMAQGIWPFPDLATVNRWPLCTASRSQCVWVTPFRQGGTLAFSKRTCQ